MSTTARILEPYDRWNIINCIRSKKAKKVTLPENEMLNSASPIIMEWPADIKKPYIGLVQSENFAHAYWPKFERFFQNNKIPYDYFDIKNSAFIHEAKKFDIIVWRTPSAYSEQWEATDKIEFLQSFLGKIILPSKEALWFYEDKLRMQWLFEYYNLPCIKTFISHSKEEVLEFLENVEYPIISKDKTSSSSEGVILVKNKKQAYKMCRHIFSNGMKLYERYIRQKNYVLFQEAVPNYGFDLRVIIVGKYYFGYYRYPQKDDYRASGSGIVQKKEIPLEVLRLAKKTRDCLPKTYLLAVDFLQDKRDDKYYIIESSIFIGVESCEQLVVNGVPGRYIEENGEFTFEEGRFWIQELMMEELMKDWISQNTNRGRN
jgi:glutathione synthase/RimK-type ligase-like ATP-grasp enzyme